ncbi:hypothetical protein [Clostridium tyrobutyricum]|jgi:membrane-bound metal-dependent hydrolase YbcI (DUF457 family)|uniref:hypothetical protein n=2 Tax=Clostridium tyrobutyricum TaxID=1519 RepID=UPI00073DA8A2|nr:hypothetical protein [Clostridium tyrobutyricum]
MNTKPRINGYIIILIIAFLFEVFLDFIMNNGTGRIYEFFVKYYRYQFFTATFVVLYILIFIIIYRGITSFYEGEIKDRDDRLKDKACQIWENYNELYKYKVNEIITNIIKKYVSKDEFVLSVQLYKYSIKYLRDEVVFKINYNYGYVTEGMDINSIMQSYYKINKNVFDEYNKAINGNDNSIILKFALKYISILNDKSLNELNEGDSLIYELVLLAMQQILQDMRITGILDSDKEDKLLQIKRNGIIRGILNKDFYTFTNHRNNAKKNRIYITKTILIENVQHIVLITVSPHFANIYNTDNQSIKLKKKCETFISYLEKDINIIYN